MTEQDSGQTPAPVVPPIDTPSGDDFDRERAMATIHKLREFEKTAKQSLKELDELRAKVKADEEAKLTEAEKLQKRMAELEKTIADKDAAIAEREAKVKDADRRVLVAKVATGLGAVDATDANILLATAEIDPASGTATKDIQTALEVLQKAKPYLFRQPGQVEPFNVGQGTQGQSETVEQRRARIYGGGGSLFDTGTAKARGGGVIISQPLDAPVPK